MKRANIWKGKLDWQSEFSHRFACWAKNHRGWAKMKKSNKRVAKRRLKQEWKRDGDVNADCPLCADYCPVVDAPGVCRFEERNKTNAKNDEAGHRD